MEKLEHQLQTVSLDADEIFLTGTAAEVAPVGKIDDTEYKVGPITEMLKQNYSDLVRNKYTIAKSA
jgi:branched-subunit amino acid aminotransferase/4-amino-4-deoxychorismate lyase